MYPKKRGNDTEDGKGNRTNKNVIKNMMMQEEYRITH